MADDEREALIEIIGRVFYNSHVDPTGHTVDAILAAGFHRTVQSETRRVERLRIQKDGA